MQNRIDGIKECLNEDIDLLLKAVSPPEKIHQKWSEVVSLVEECGRFHGTVARVARIWEMVKSRTGEFPSEQIDDSCIVGDCLREFRSFLIASAEEGRDLCYKYLRQDGPSDEVIALNTLFSMVIYVCRTCQEQSEPCMLNRVLRDAEVIEVVQTEVKKQM